jgi:8-oxo-dGTP pyrophosphatase MutT (NUDIX family)
MDRTPIAEESTGRGAGSARPVPEDDVRSKGRKRVEQAAAIALRKGRVCLVTSRSGKRWVVPKGRLELGKTPDEIALQEAWEEAGLVGAVREDPLGSYCYRKAGRLHTVTVFLMDVSEAKLQPSKIFLMDVSEVVGKWPECRWRERLWLSPQKALRRLRDDGLRQLLLAAVSPAVFEG